MRIVSCIPLLLTGLWPASVFAADKFEVTLNDVALKVGDSVALTFESELSPARDPSLENWVAGVCLASIFAARRGFVRVAVKQDGGCEGGVENGVLHSSCAFEYELGYGRLRTETEYDAVEYAERCETGLLAKTDLSRLH